MEEKIEALETKKRDLLIVDPRNIFVQEGFNTRKEFELDDLINSIKANSIQNPLTCWKEAGSERYYLIDGERRWRAAMSLFEKEGRLILCPVISIKKPTPEKMAFMLITKNDGKHLTVIEFAETVERIKNYGYTEAEIANETGKTVQHIYKMLEMAKLPKSVKNEINEGSVSATTVLNVQKALKDPEKIVDVVKKAKEKREKLDCVPGVEDGGCVLKKAKKVSKIELDAKDIEEELLKDGYKKTVLHKTICCQSCLFPYLLDNCKKVNCLLVTNKGVQTELDELDVTIEYQNAKLHADCPLRKNKLNIELA